MCWTSGSRSWRDFESGQWSMTELCERYGVTRPTGYKWLARHRAGGRAGLADRSRAPHRCPHRTSDATRGADRRGAPGVRLGREEAAAGPPHAASDAARGRRAVRSTTILERHKLLRKNRRRRTWTHPGATPVQTDHPNQVWPADFKGQFKTGDGQYCYPLTVTDHFSRGPVGVSRTPVGEDGARATGVPRALPRGRLARRDPHRQRRARSPRPASTACRP